MAGTEFGAGVARVTITPPVGIPLIGFAGRGPADGLHDDLTATALVLQGPSTGGGDEVTQVAIVACDLLFLMSEEVHAVRAATAQLTDVPAENLILACSHTHYGPSTTTSRGDAPQIRPYLDNLVHLLAGAVAAARAQVVPCRLGWGQGEVTIGINRRERTADGRMILGQNPSGPVDPRVAVLRIDRAGGGPLAAVLNYACHPVSLAGRCTQISADFPAVARRLVEQETGATCLFLQGAAANINPLLMGWDWSHVSRLGLPLGAEAVRVYMSSPLDEGIGTGGLTVARTTLDLPPLLPASVEEGKERVAALEAEHQRLLARDEPGTLWWTELRLEQARQGLAALRGGAALATIPAELAAVRLSEQVGLITAPGEIFTEIGQAIVAGSPFGHTLYAGYTDGSISYVPTRAAYPEGGYEVTHACRVAPEAGEMIQKESIGLLARAWAADFPGARAG